MFISGAQVILISFNPVHDENQAGQAIQSCGGGPLRPSQNPKTKFVNRLAGPGVCRTFMSSPPHPRSLPPHPTSLPHHRTTTPPHPTTTPLIATSKRLKSDHRTPEVVSQETLQKSISREIRDHVWKFDPERIAKMLSATGNGPTEALVELAHKELKISPRWPITKAEKDWYSPIAAFLNNYVDACNAALPAAAEDARLYDRLRFVVYDRPTVDGIEGAAPVKPDIVGGLDLISGQRTAWSPRRNADAKQVLFPVAVKAEWAPMINQAATYARCLFSASPSRHFVVALGFRHTSAQLRFLVFHRGGLAASHELSVYNKDHQKGILRIFLSILSWKSAGDAGFLEFCNDLEMSLACRMLKPSVSDG